jgi:hypothetical protein
MSNGKLRPGQKIEEKKVDKYEIIKVDGPLYLLHIYIDYSYTLRAIHYSKKMAATKYVVIQDYINKQSKLKSC